jgi:hypothetical protein
MTEIKGLPAESLNHGCTDRPIDPLFETTQAYDFKHIEDTVYRFAESEPHVKQALEVIEKAYRDYRYRSKRG